MSGGRDIPVAADGPPPTCVEAEPFALRVTDDSMAPELPRGCIVVVDPTVEPVEGRFFVAGPARAPVLGRLRADADAWRLESLDGRVLLGPVQRAQLLGGVTQRAGRRRRERRRYE